MPRQFPYWDIKFYYGIHVNKQKAQWLNPCTYNGFVHRLIKWMNLHDAIYTPRVEYQVRDKKFYPTSADHYRRRQMLNEENVMILDFDEMEKLEILPPNKENMAKYNMKPKKTLLQKFISYFKKLWQKKES